MLIQITSNYFCAGLILDDFVCTESAPILRYMRGWCLAKIKAYSQSKGWKLGIIE
jgi:hypothetical protein